jgi:POT family proton-dependent oligopeptide transporter
MSTHPSAAAARDVKQLGTFAAIASLGYVFWVCGAMEMVERLAWYGARQVSGLYATDAVSNGGLGLVESDLGIIFAAWAVTQTFVPVFTGGISDRIGYKETIALSTVLKIAGYLLMATLPSFHGFLAGAVVVACGTGIFKPGIQGTIARSCTRENSSVAWGIFYQTVNIGGFIGPILAAHLRQLAWANVFYACAVIIALNFLLLLCYTEPGKAERLARRAALAASGAKEEPLWRASLRELRNPVLLWYIALFCGFWFMLMILWDVAPLYFRDWVDTSRLVTDVFGSEGTRNKAVIFFFGLDKGGTHMLPEGLVNLNALLIMTTCFLVAGWGARMRAANAMALGTLLAASALLVFGGFNAAWVIVAALAVFSVGEMLSSPKSSEYAANIAPEDRKAMYLGFSQLPIGVGWSLESYLGPTLYGEYASRETISRRALEGYGLDATQIAAIPNGEAFMRLVALSGQPAPAMQAQLYAANEIGALWYLMGSVGLVTAFGLWVYGRWTYRLASG